MTNPDLVRNTGETHVPENTSNTGGLAPQATSVAGAPEPPPSTIASTGGVGPVMVLNPFGPDNRLDQGGITFAINDLIYDQFMDAQQQLEITDDTEPGTVILQIPYDPTGEFMNDFIRVYASFHSRYNGDIIIRSIMIGNATFSGTLMWFWYPTRYPKRIALFSDAQKYAYKCQSVCLPSVEEIILKDARKYYYYRETNEVDIDSRPHIVLAVHTSVVSPLREGIKVRLRIASRLASQTDLAMGKMVKPFMFANPVAEPITPAPGGKDLNGRKLEEVFPNFAIRPLFMALDGRSTAGKYSFLDTNEELIPFTYNMPIPTLAGGVFADNDNKRLVTSNFQQGVIHDDKIRNVVLVTQLPVNIEKRIAIRPDFIALCDGDDWLAKVDSLSYLSGDVEVYVSRINNAHISVYKDPKSNFNIVMVKQISCITNYGYLVVFSYENVVPSNDLRYAAMSGIPNTPLGTPICLPNNPILGPVSLSHKLTSFPSNWVGLKLTELEPPVVSSGTELAPSILTSEVVTSYFLRLSEGIASEESLQFDLLDPIARTRVVTARFLPKVAEFVINPMDTAIYKQYPGKTRELIIGGYGVVPNSTSFPMTDTSYWPKRYSETPLLSTPRYTSISYHVKPNAAIAALGVAELAEGAEAASFLVQAELPSHH